MIKIKLTISMVITLLNNYFKEVQIVYKYDSINNDILVCDYINNTFKLIILNQLIKDFKYYILSSKYEKIESIKLLNKVTFFD